MEINTLIDDYRQQLKIKMNARKLAVYDTKNRIYKDMIGE